MIQKLTLVDLYEVYDIQKECYPEEVMDSLDKTMTFFDWEISHGIKVDNTIKGIVFGYVEKDFLHVYSVEVVKDCRGAGMASELLEFCLDYAKKNSLRTVRAYGFSQGGKNLLKKFGFVKISEKNLLHYIMDVMTLELNQ